MLLNWLFNKMYGTKRNTWLSVRFHRWLQARKWARNEAYKSSERNVNYFFEVQGAGEISISEEIFLCGNAAGFSFEVSWASGGFGGGVIGLGEAKRLAEYLLKRCDEEKRTEQEIQDEHDKRMTEYFKNVDK